MMIRLQRIGRTNDPAFRIAVLEKARAAKSSRIVENLGTYNPHSKALTLDAEKTKGWISKGAEPTGSVWNLLIKKGIIEGKKVDMLPSRKPKMEEAKATPAVETPTTEAVPAGQ